MFGEGEKTEMKQKLIKAIAIICILAILTPIGVHAASSGCFHGAGTYEVYVGDVQRQIRTYSRVVGYNSYTGEAIYKPWVVHGKYHKYNVYCKKCDAYMGSREEGPVETYESPAY